MLQRVKRFVKDFGKRAFLVAFRAYGLSPGFVRERVRLLPGLTPPRLERLIRNHWESQFPPDDGFKNLYPSAAPVSAPASQLWENVDPPFRQATPTIDIVIPVYRGLDETLNCIYSVLRSKNETAYEMVVVDDKSPEAELSEKLGELASRGLITILRNRRNLGFVGSVNRGMRLHMDRDVLLLNSDTEVYGDWLDRMMAVAVSDPRIASVTPFTTNGTIASYPIFLRDNYMRLEPSYQQIDAIAAASKLMEPVDIPTAVGFCMLIPRRALNAVGYFDARRFGRGYGEENDFSRRAVAKGWRNVLAPNIFVRHMGETSFQGEKRLRVKFAMEQLSKLYPDYHEIVQKHIEKNPALPARREIDVGRLVQNASPAMLFIVHSLGGGVLRNAGDLERRLMAEGVRVIYMRPDMKKPSRVVLSSNEILYTPNAVFDLREEASELREALRRIGVFHIHVHQLLEYENGAGQDLAKLAGDLNVRYDVTLHDYFSICPRINMIGLRDRFCGEPDLEACEACALAGNRLTSPMSVKNWRVINGAFLRAARKLYAPSHDVRDRFLRYFPGLNIAMLPHVETNRVKTPITRTDKAVVDIAVLGAIGRHKGSDVVKGCAKDAADRNLPLKFQIVGFLDNPEGLELATLTETGEYESDEEALALLAAIQPKLCFFSAVWPETYSYTLSLAQAAGIYPVSFDVGAIAERIKATGWGTTIPLDTMGDFRAINDILLSIEAVEDPSQGKLLASSYASILADYYGLTAGPS
jgi:GT2 family glycosyltransferase/glycosyltransferase involved in cell wall biosynthesis